MESNGAYKLLGIDGSEYESAIKAAPAADDKRELLNLVDLDRFDEVFMANLSPRKDPDNRQEWLDAWENFKNL